ncbi:ATPase [Paenibacillus alvei TS-15]|uniref:ATPase n=1 Tax=Paenibacillus alvei TS-15 TaxID=1117108 RepID=S9TTY7_PAEAL|nr:AAA family ATPase [Paenibacillus alvei]EPY05766.1 ATPase [Paenibacillus alvei TS-15]
MSRVMIKNWYDANQEYLSIALASMRNSLESYSLEKEEKQGESTMNTIGLRSRRTRPTFIQRLISQFRRNHVEHVIDTPIKRQILPVKEKVLPDMTPPAALEALCSALHLSQFERNILLLCAGIEMDSRFARLCSAIQGDPARSYSTFSLALTLWPDGHWSALTPESPLRRWRLIEIGAGHELVYSPLRIDEWTLHYLAGTSYMDERLVGLVDPLRDSDTLVPSHEALVEQVTGAWTQTKGAAVIQLYGAENVIRRSIAAKACSLKGTNLFVLSADLIPTSTADFDTLISLWEREALLSKSTLFLDCDRLDEMDTSRINALIRLVERMNAPMIVSSREQRRIQHRQMLVLEVQKPSAGEQKTVWKSVIGKDIPDASAKADALVSQFNFDTMTIYSIGAQGFDQQEALWDACRVQTRLRMSDLAQRIDSPATWSDLVIPEPQMQMLREIVAQVRQRGVVYENWGLGARSSRGLGISVLFAGPSGTGKTLAAEVLANELRLDLYRVDLSSVVSKYIGETEKNLRRIFDAAEDGGSILLFDEADALFGKRSEVTDSHDRYANLEVSYLLQRMETYRGLAILTTNMKSALDQAFLRRIRFVVQFPFPDAQQRAEIWRRIYLPTTPTEELDLGQLGRLQIAGGNIRNIALNAAFLAADEGKPIGMTHLQRAAQSEFAKLEKALAEIKIGGFSDATKH